VLVALAATIACPRPAAAQQEGDAEQPRRTIAVSGQGEVQAASDTVAINVGVVTEADSAKKALAANNQAMQQLFNVLDRQQIDKKDRQTVRFDVSPQYQQEQPPGMRHADEMRPGTGEPQEPRIIGYQVTNEVRIQLRDVSQLGTVLDAVVNAGSNRINSIEFSVEDSEQLLDKARRRAVENAREKAELLAEAAGASVGNVVTIREQQVSQPLSQNRYMMAEAQAVPIAPGEQTLAAQVDVTFELEVQSE